jgi:hypothetical protein
MQPWRALLHFSSNPGFFSERPVIQVRRFYPMENLDAFDPLWTPRCFIAIPHPQHSIPQLVEGDIIIVNRVDYTSEYPSPFHPAHILSVKTPRKRIGDLPSQLHKALLLGFGPGIGATLYIPFIRPTRPDQILRQLGDPTIILDVDLLHVTSSDGHSFIFPKPFLARLIPSGRTRSIALLNFISLPITMHTILENGITISECLVN